MVSKVHLSSSYHSKYASSFNAYFCRKSQILALHQAGHSIHFIASQLERSRHIVSNFLNNLDSYDQRTSPGRLRVISKREKRQILREVSNTTISVGQIRANLNLAASRTTVWRVINASPNTQREAVRKAPRLTATQGTLRLRFASENIGGIGLSRRNFEGGSVMVWGAISNECTLTLAFVSNRMNSEEYQNVLENHLLPFLEERRTEAFVFQKGNATIHVSNATKS
ncbi:transposase [Oesophagostomum dentatum]|uniref:Transposase n=1 Tax=Oesophagostomum dentatum TaxID=61180 RepID=A0A0B1SWV2_OESDE|nr:transposase [Oesophagostomum dentatum]